MTALLLLLAALFAPAPLVLGIVHASRAVRSELTPRVLVVRVPVPVERLGPTMAKCAAPLPAPALGRGDMVDIRGTPFYGIVQCVDGAVAWCKVSKPTPGGHIFLVNDDPRPLPVGSLHVVDRGLPIVGAVN